MSENETIKPHDEIWLQWSGPDYPEDAERYFSDDVTWCKDQINPEDIRYIRADLVRQEGMKMANVPLVDQLSEMDERIAELEEILETSGVRTCVFCGQDLIWRNKESWESGESGWMHVTISEFSPDHSASPENQR